MDPSSSAPCESTLRTIADVGLSSTLVKRYEAIGITTLFEWQAAALRRPGVLDGTRHLLYTATTSAGKTLVAELLLLKRIQSAGGRAKALYILPLRALVTQKAQDLARLLDKTGITSSAYCAGAGELPLPRRLNVAVCTIEKAAMVVQSMAEAGRLGEIVAVVCDEFHILGESRGAALERTLATLLLFARRSLVATDAPAGSGGAATSPAASCSVAPIEPSSGQRGSAQLIGMSATLPNVRTRVQRPHAVRILSLLTHASARLTCVPPSVPTQLSELVEWLKPCEQFEAGGRREVRPSQPLHPPCLVSHPRSRID